MSRLARWRHTTGSAGRFAAPERSIDYAVRAGDLAQAGFAYEDAVTHWQSALDLMAHHGVAAERRATLLEKLGEHLFIFNPGDEGAVGYLEQGLALYEQIGEREAVARLHLRLGLLLGASLTDRQDIPRALRHARLAAMSVPTNVLSAARRVAVRQSVLLQPAATRSARGV